jgi:CheY-like chemotaxis protein/Tfp pilus assembly protein PilZ
MLLEIGKSFLANSPVQVFTALNGEEALAIIAKELPDLVVLDQNMPKMNGITCCIAMRNDPAMQTIPVIMISSSASQADLEAFDGAGCSGFLPKPLDRQYFLETVRKFLPAIERRGARVPCGSTVTMEFSGELFSGTIEDISIGGVYVATDYEVAAGSRITLCFSLPGNRDTTLITARGRVVWLNRAPKKAHPRFPAGLGVEFLEITGKGLAILRKNEISEFVESGVKNSTTKGSR